MSPSVLHHAPYVLENAHQLKGHKVLIVGDIGLDEYIWGHAKRISPEAPVPVVEVEKEEMRLGLAANVAQNVSSLGGVPHLISVVGQDSASDQLRSLLKAAGVSPDSLVVDKQRPTTRKARVMVQNHHIVRVDYEHRQFVSASVEAEVIARAKALMPSVSAVILQDYAKGVVSESLAQAIIKLAKDHGKKVLADPNRTTPIKYYRGVDIMTPNFDESVALTGEAVDDHRPDSELVSRIGQKLMDAVQSKTMVITRGKEGMRLFENGGVHDLPTYARAVSDVTGAGDTVIAALALAWGSGFTLERACALSNFAAGVVVGKVGCVPCTTEELMNYIREHQV